MNEPIYFNEEFKAQGRYAMEQAKTDREKYFNWIKDEINIAITLINKYDKIYVLGGLGYMGIIKKANCSKTGSDYFTSDTSKYLANDVTMVIEKIKLAGFFWTDEEFII